MGLRMFSTSSSSCWSIGSAAHWAHCAMRCGLALPVMQVVMSGLAIEYCRASLAMSEPLAAQCLAAWAAISRTCGGALCHLGSGALGGRRALEGGGFMVALPLAFRE